MLARHFLRCFLLVVTFGSALPIIAQYTTGTVAGVITDPTGATVPGATVTLTSESTTQVRTYVTDATGNYDFPAVSPGRYQLNVAAAGFGAVQTVLDATSTTLTQNLTLKPANQAATVEVTSTSADLNLSDAHQTTTRSSTEIAYLPNQTRNPQGLVFLEPAVTPMYSPRGQNASLVAISGAQTGQIAAYGGRGRATAYSLDYTDINDWEFGGFALGTQPSISMISEFKVLTGVFPAEFGLQSSNVVAITKSGTNNLHGELYDFIENDALDARDYFDTTGKATPLKQNIYGFNAGVPVWRNHSFLFGGYEKTTTRGAGTIVPLLFPNTNALAQATDPVSKQLLQTLLPSIPQPSASNPTALTTTVNQLYTGPGDSHLYLIRGDHHFSNAHSVGVRYLYSEGNTVLPYPTFGAPVGNGAFLSTGTHSVNISDTYIFSNNKINELRVAYGRSIGELPPQQDPATPRYNITGVINLGDYQAFPQGRIFNVYQVNDAFSWIHGRHSIKFGADVRYIQDQSSNVSSGRGIYTFPNLPSFLNGTFSLYSQTFGATTRNYRVWIPGFFVQDEWKALPTLTVSAGLRYEPQGSLTEAHGLLSLLDPTLQGVAVGAAGTGPLGAFRSGKTGINANYTNLEPRLAFSWNPGSGRAVIRGGYGVLFDDFNFALLSNIRVGPPLNYSVQLPGPSGANTFDALSAGTAPIQTATQQQIGTFGTLKNFGAITTVSRSLANPYTQNFTLGVQYQITPKAVASADYLGSVTRKLTDLSPINSVQAANRPAPATSVADEASRLKQFQAAVAAENGANNNRIDARFNQTDQYQAAGSSNYNALAVQLKQSVLYGLEAQFAYTWSRSLDNDSDFNLAQIGQDLSYPQGQGASFRSLEYGPSDFDITNRIVLTTVWRLPFFAGQQDFTGHVLGGWNFTTVEQWQSGVPASIQNGTRLGITDVNIDGNTANGQDNTRASLRPEGVDFKLSKSRTTLNSGTTATTNPILNTQNLKYVPTLLGNTGTLGRDTFRMPSIANADWSLAKDTHLFEGGFLGGGPWNLEVRADAFNIFNIPFVTATGSNWNTISSGAFGLTNTAGSTRKIQIAAKVTF
jgi:hypothetical protein